MGKASTDKGTIRAMLLLIDMAPTMKEFYQFTFGVRDGDLYPFHVRGEHLGNFFAEGMQADVLQGGYGDGVRVKVEIKFCRVVEQINFIECAHTRLLAGSEVIEDVIARFASFNGTFMADIDDFQQEVGID